MYKALCFVCGWTDTIVCGYDDTIFTIEDPKCYVPVVILTTRKKKLSTVLSREFERSIYWNEYKTKSENKNTTNEYRYLTAKIAKKNVHY